MDQAFSISSNNNINITIQVHGTLVKQGCLKRTYWGQSCVCVERLFFCEQETGHVHLPVASDRNEAITSHFTILACAVKNTFSDHRQVGRFENAPAAETSFTQHFYGTPGRPGRSDRRPGVLPLPASQRSACLASRCFGCRS